MENEEELAMEVRKTDQRSRQESGLGGVRKFRRAMPSVTSNAMKSRMRTAKKSLVTLGSRFSRKRWGGDLV